MEKVRKVPSSFLTGGTARGVEVWRHRSPSPALRLPVLIPLLLVLVLSCSKRSTVENGGDRVREGRVEEGQLRRPASRDEEYTYGYRVQLYATRDVDKARNVAESAQRLFSVDVYIEFYEPLYKVRIGDYPDREQAEQMRQHVSSRGFADAWIVETTIRTADRRR